MSVKTPTAPGLQPLRSYLIDGDQRRVYAVAVPDEPGFSLIDVRAEPLPDDGDHDERHVESNIPTLAEARAIAEDYGQLAERIGWCPMDGVWW